MSNLNQYLSRLSSLKSEFYINLIDWCISVDSDATPYWVSAFKAANCDAFQNALQKCGIPVVAEDEATHFHSRGLKNELVIHRRIYKSSSDKDKKIHTILPLFATIYHQILKIEEVLNSLHQFGQDDLNPIQLALKMFQSVHDELKFAPKNSKTSEAYESRFSKAQEQLVIVKNKFKESMNKLNYQAEQLRECLNILKENLVNGYSVLKDERYGVTVLGYRCRDFSPWQNIFINTVNHMFGATGIEYPEKDSMAFSGNKIEAVITFIMNDKLSPRTLFQERHDTLVQATTDKSNQVRTELDSLKQHVSTQQKLEENNVNTSDDKQDSVDSLEYVSYK